MNNLDIDALFTAADDEYNRRLELEGRIRTLALNPDIRSAKQFVKPFFVIVHKDELDRQRKFLPDDQRRKVLDDINEIEDIYEHIQLIGKPWLVEPGMLLSENGEIDTNRPVLVCGVFCAICVREQYIALLRAGYNAYVSDIGVMG